MRRMVLIVAVLALAVGAGCSTFGRNAFAEPKVSLRTVHLNGVGLNGGSLDIVLNVYNPNGFRLDAKKVSYELMLDTIPFGKGSTDSNIVLNGKDSSTVRLPLDFTWAGVGAAGRELLNTGSVQYSVRGFLTIGSPVGGRTIPYDGRGRLSTLRGTRP